MKLEIKVKEVIPTVSPEQAVEDFKAIIGAYKVQNPEKYVLKETALLKELAKLESLAKPAKKEAPAPAPAEDAEDAEEIKPAKVVNKKAAGKAVNKK